jgi:hypothetical protein
MRSPADLSHSLDAYIHRATLVGRDTLSSGFSPLARQPAATSSSAAAGALRLEPEYAAKSPVHLVHEGCGRVAGGFLKIGLIESDEGGDVDD